MGDASKHRHSKLRSGGSCFYILSAWFHQRSRLNCYYAANWLEIAYKISYQAKKNRPPPQCFTRHTSVSTTNNSWLLHRSACMLDKHSYPNEPPKHRLCVRVWVYAIYECTQNLDISMLHFRQITFLMTSWPHDLSTVFNFCVLNRILVLSLLILSMGANILNFYIVFPPFAREMQAGTQY